MYILTIRTDKPIAEIGLYQDKKKLAYKKWQGHRLLSVTLHQQIEKVLSAEKKRYNDISGIVFFAGPGSFTGLRIGASVASSLAFGLDIPIINSSGADWIKNGSSKISAGKNDKVALPKYGAKPNITEPKK